MFAARIRPAMRAFAPSRTALTWLLVLALLGGALEIHVEAGHAGPAAALEGGGEVFVCADGHAPGTHVERARPEEHDGCAACLHRLQVHGGDLVRLALHGDGGDGSAAVEPRPAALPTPVLDHAPSRGPPAA